MEKEIIKILIVEDSSDQIKVLEDSIEDFNLEDKKYQIEFETSLTYEKSLSMLLEKNFDAAIIDLSLSSTGMEDSEFEGNKLVDIISKKLRIPIIVRSGFPQKADSDILGLDNEFYKVYSKAENVDILLSQIETWMDSGLSIALKTNGPVEQYLNDIFWVHFSKNFKEWQEVEDNESKQKALLRYTFYLLQEHLGINIESGNFESFHSAEFYIDPPLNKEELFFGDILIHDEQSYFILTPACEMAQRKFSKVLLAKIVPFEEVEKFSESKHNFFEEKDKFVDSKVSSSTKKLDRKKDDLERWFRNGHTNSLGYHFIPPTLRFPGGFIDFQQLISVDPDVFPHEKIITVSSQFSKDISSRFTLYYARQGQPNLNSDVIISTLTR